MDYEKELRDIFLSVKFQIDVQAHLATYRLWDMFVVGTGICHCGTDMNNHPLWDNHSPVEMMIDKSRE